MPTGQVLFWKESADSKPYGFIKPDDAAPGDFDANVYFNERALRGEIIGRGDRVEYTLFEEDRKGRGPQAFRVLLLEESNAITTLGGEDDY